MKRSVTLLTALALSVSALAACGGEEETVVTAAAETEPEETTAAETKIPPLGLEDGLDYGGYEYTIYGYDLSRFISEQKVDELTGDLVNDAVYERNRAAEELLNVKINVIINKWDNADCRKRITQSAMAGDDDYDLFTGNTYNMTYLAASGAFLDAENLINADFSMPWWNSSAYSELSVGKSHLLFMGDICRSNYGDINCIIFNKSFIGDYGFDHPYQLVEDNKWTLDRLISDTKDFYVDRNGNGARDEYEDLYGTYALIGTANGWGNEYVDITKKNADNYPEIVIDSPRTEEIWTKLRSWIKESSGFWTGEGWTDANTFGEAENCVYLFRTIHTCTYLRNFDVDYGIVPLPKYDESDDWSERSGGLIIAFPSSAKDAGRSSAVAEALAYYARELVYPAYVEQTIFIKGTRDDTAEDMLHIILDHITYNFGIECSSATDYLSWGFAFGEFTKSTKGYGSFMAAYKTHADKEISDYVDMIDALG